MIDVQKYERILEEGLILDHYFLLLSIREGSEIPKSKRMRGFINIMTAKGYINEGSITEAGEELLDGVSTTTTTTSSIDFGGWVMSLHQKCQERLKELTGSTQVQARINPRSKPYPFLSNPTDLGKVILRAINSYKLKDLNTIEATILNYITESAEKNEWFPLLKYYIMKDGQSTMVTEMMSPNKEKTIVKSTQKHV